MMIKIKEPTCSLTLMSRVAQQVANRAQAPPLILALHVQTHISLTLILARNLAQMVHGKIVIITYALSAQLVVKLALDPIKKLNALLALMIISKRTEAALIDAQQDTGAIEELMNANVSLF